jgi:hypothetical protein
MAEENVCDRVGDGKARRAFEPEEFARRIEFEKDVLVVGCENDVDGAVVQVVERCQRSVRGARYAAKQMAGANEESMDQYTPAPLLTVNDYAVASVLRPPKRKVRTSPATNPPMWAM